MNIKTKNKRYEKEQKRLDLQYQNMVKAKPREEAWREYKATGKKYK
tara:strand:+ start:355 stop:492 length:138 start_codon:yes stop_codon:yes gene_type:complete